MAYRKGDTVSWNTSQGTTHGQVVDKRTSEFEFEGQTFKPRHDDPYYIVESDKTGSRAAHLESALRKRS
jgi:Hypervirulence associated proteins TUDOR domain